MDDKIKEYFRNLIYNRLRLLEGRSSGEDGDEPAKLPDEIDNAVILQHHQIDMTLGSIKRAEISELRDALHKIQEGTYGICEECNKKIPEKRLKIHPAGRLCVACQDSMEKTGKNIRPRYFNKINLAILDEGTGKRQAL